MLGWLGARNMGTAWMAWILVAGTAIGVAAAFLACGCEHAPAAGKNSEQSAIGASTGAGWGGRSPEPIEPLPLAVEIAVPVAELGERLFFSPAVSSDGHVACSSCHALDHGMADRSAFSEVPFRPATATNSTSLFNARYFYKIKWSGEFNSLEAHLDALVRTPKIMGSDWSEIAARLSTDPSWVARFRAVFSDGLSAENIRKALLEYERSLVTPNAPFDRYLRGDDGALSRDAKKGYDIFKDYGCISCHQGMAVGANMLARFGVMGNQCAAASTRDENEGDLGRFSVTHKAEDRHVFRVPSLRNVAVTAPYFHDGSAETLDAAVRIMAECQLGRELPDEDIDAIVAYLRSLTGEYRGKPL
jgi:cytochrome c peroxidase